MLTNFTYYDKNGEKWSIEKGDWVSHQSTEIKPVIKKEFSIGYFEFFIVTVIISAILFAINFL